MEEQTSPGVIAFASSEYPENMMLLLDRAETLKFSLQEFNEVPASFAKDVKVVVICAAPTNPKAPGEKSMSMNMTYAATAAKVRAKTSIPIVLVPSTFKTVGDDFPITMLESRLKHEGLQFESVNLIPASEACVGADLRDPFTFVVFSAAELKTEDSTEDEHLNAVLLCLAGQD